MVLAYVGWLAVLFTSVQFFPQVFKAYKTKQLADISLQTFVLVMISASLWTIYGIHTKDSVIITANVIVFFCATAIVALKFKYHQ